MTGVASARTFQRWAKEGRLAHVVLPNGRVRFRLSDVEALLRPVEAADDQGDGVSFDDTPLPGFDAQVVPA